MAKNDHIKHAVLNKILSGNPWNPIGNSKFDANGRIIHMRYCSPNSAANPKYKFNINPNTLSADYEVWICGAENDYYLIPKDIIEDMYSDSDAYVDSHHPKIRVVSVDKNNDTAMYAKGGKSANLNPYFRATL
jgi:hypothetical protein